VKRELKALVASLLKEHNIMSVATVRPDGFPQATTVVYANDGVRLYFACDRGCQKVRNLARSPKVSVTIANDYEDWSQIRGLSIGGIAEVVKSPAEQRKAWRLLGAKFPGLDGLSAEERADTAVVRISPKVISVIDYRRGLGHTDLVEVGARAG
jgi:PPOX class probable F420-dependent enzyme